MSEIQKVELGSKCIVGLATRTKNSDENEVATAKIAPLWQKFSKELLVQDQDNSVIYVVYHNYEYDEHAAYDVLIGTETCSSTQEMEQVVLDEGRYLKFPVKGELPHAIRETWEEIWHYFADESVDERRNFTSDFELYKSENEVEIYISVNYF